MTRKGTHHLDHFVLSLQFQILLNLCDVTEGKQFALTVAEGHALAIELEPTSRRWKLDQLIICQVRLIHCENVFN